MGRPSKVIVAEKSSIARSPAGVNMKIIVKNRAGEEFYCSLHKNIFEKMSPSCSVEVFEKEGMNPRKYVREYLELVFGGLKETTLE
jgi:hypothetical protein